jgi:DNA-binding GntR family transcriptional regulator
MAFRQMLFEHATRYRRLALKLGAHAHTRHESHQRLRDAALNRDVDVLVFEMTGHIRDAYEAVRQGLVALAK